MISRARFRLVVWGLAAWAALVWGRLAQVQVLDHQTLERRGGPAAREGDRGGEAAGRHPDPRRPPAGRLPRAPARCTPTRGRSLAQAWPELAARLAPLTGQSAAQVLGELGTHDGFFYLAKELDPEVEAKVVASAPARGRHHPHRAARLPPRHAGRPAHRFRGRRGSRQGRAGVLLRPHPGRGTGGLSRAARRQELPHPSRPASRARGSARSVAAALDRQPDPAGGRGRAGAHHRRDRRRVGLGRGHGRLHGRAARPGVSSVLRPGTSRARRRRSSNATTPSQDMLEPGSTFKPIIVCAALTHGVLKPWDMVDCSGGGVQVAGVFMRDHANYGALSVRDMLAKSSNAGTIRVALRLSPEQLDRFIRALGFGQPTGIGLPGEMRGLYQGPGALVGAVPRRLWRSARRSPSRRCSSPGPTPPSPTAATAGAAGAGARDPRRRGPPGDAVPARARRSASCPRRWPAPWHPCSRR